MKNIYAKICEPRSETRKQHDFLIRQFVYLISKQVRLKLSKSLSAFPIFSRALKQAESWAEQPFGSPGIQYEGMRKSLSLIMERYSQPSFESEAMANLEEEPRNPP